MDLNFCGAVFQISVFELGNLVPNYGRSRCLRTGIRRIALYSGTAHDSRLDENYLADGFGKYFGIS